jgi:hypothetical protein
MVATTAAMNTHESGPKRLPVKGPNRARIAGFTAKGPGIYISLKD